MATTTQQYHPLTSVETAVDDALSTHYYREAVRNSNCCKANTAPRHALYDADSLLTNHTTAAETVIRQWVVKADHGYPTFRVEAWAYANNAAADPTITIYADRFPYRSAAPFATTQLTPDVFESVTFTIDASVGGLATGVWQEDDLTVVRRPDGFCNIIMTATNAGAAAGVRWGALSCWQKPLSL